MPFGWHLPNLKKRSDNMTSAAKRRRKENVAEPAPKITWKEIKRQKVLLPKTVCSILLLWDGIISNFCFQMPHF